MSPLDVLVCFPTPQNKLVNMFQLTMGNHQQLYLWVDN